ncbi:MAG: polysaccharide deacetylase family protein [Syntrophobacteraceae bacterium]
MKRASGLLTNDLGLSDSYMPRRYSSIWKRPLPDWRQRLVAVSERLASDRLPPIFFRADDIGAASKAFDALCKLFRYHQVPLALAVVPAWLSEARQERLFHAARIEESLWSWHQHGWRHVNWQNEGKKCEFGSDRSPEHQHADILQGRLKMERVFGPYFVPIFTPPWNRFSPSTIRALRKLNFKGISAALPLPPGTKIPYGFQNRPAWLDLHTRKGKDPGLDLDCLLEEFSSLPKMKDPVGIIIHHQRMTPFAFEFLDQMLYNLVSIVGAQFHSFKGILDCTNEKQAGSRLC